MKRNLTIILAGAALLALAGCSREPLADEPGTQVLSAEIVDDAATRTTYSSATGAFAWEIGDEMALFQSKGSPATYKFQTVKISAIDSGVGKCVYSKETNWIRTGYAVYPASLVTASSWDGSALTLTLPASYDASESTKLPLVAVNSGNTLAFKAACGLLRIQCDNIPSGVTSLTVTVNGNNSITGTYSVSGLGTATPKINAAAGSAKSVTFAVSGTSATLNLPLPCGSYSGVTVTAGSKSATEAAGFTAERGIGKKVHFTAWE